MAQPVAFPGHNVVYTSENENTGDLPVFRNGSCLVSCWQLDEDELMEVIRTGRIFFASFSGDVLWPAYVGSESTTRGVVIDTGPVWPRSNLNMPGTEQ